MLARRTAAAGLTGFEWAVGVPGSVGGAVRMNAGGHGSDMAACLVDVDAVRPRRRRPGARGGAGRRALGLRFRGSDLDRRTRSSSPPGCGLRRGDRDACRGDDRRDRPLAPRAPARRAELRARCSSTRCPARSAPASLVDGLGLRGLRIGTAWVSEKHANFVQAADGGSAADVRAVIEDVRPRVADATGFRLRSEVRLVGFDDVDADVRRPGGDRRWPDARRRLPSAEVLDELLRAFSVDDRRRRWQRSTSQPEVERCSEPGTARRRAPATVNRSTRDLTV